MKKRYLGKELSERERIARKTNQRPYGVRVAVAVTDGFTGHKLLGVEKHASLRLENDLIIEVKRGKDENELRWKYELDIKAFATAGEAEEAGLRMAQTVLWMSISVRNPRLMLQYSGPLPCDVYDRRKAVGPVLRARGAVIASVEKQYKALEEGWARKKVDRRLLLAMELFCAARFETTARARFIGVVSSLEPLAVQINYDQEAYGSKIKEVAREAIESIQSTKKIPDDVEASLVGRIRNLRRESVRQAYLRLAKKHLDEENARALDEAYCLRSDMLHEGATDPDLSDITSKVEDLVRVVLAGEMQLGCVVDPSLR